jgi:hypothetical protein
MPKIGLDLTTVDAVSGGGFVNEILPPEQGPYVLRVKEAVEQKSKAGNPMAVFDFEVVENHGQEADEFVDHSGKTFRQWYPLIPRQPMVGRIKALANACDVPYDRQGLDLDDFLDAVLECDLTVDTSGDGREYNRIENPRLPPAAGGDVGGDDPGEDANPPAETPATSSQARRAPSRGRTATTRQPSPPRRNVR